MQLSIAILPLIISGANFILGRLIVGENRSKISETSGKNIQRIGLVTLLILAFSCFFFIDIMDDHVMKWYWLFFYTITLGFHLFLDWMFLKETNEYMVSLILLIIGVTYIFLFIF